METCTVDGKRFEIVYEVLTSGEDEIKVTFSTTQGDIVSGFKDQPPLEEKEQQENSLYRAILARLDKQIAAIANVLPYSGCLSLARFLSEHDDEVNDRVLARLKGLSENFWKKYNEIISNFVESAGEEKVRNAYKTLFSLLSIPSDKQRQALSLKQLIRRSEELEQVLHDFETKLSRKTFLAEDDERKKEDGFFTSALDLQKLVDIAYEANIKGMDDKERECWPRPENIPGISLIDLLSLLREKLLTDIDNLKDEKPIRYSIYTANIDTPLDRAGRNRLSGQEDRYSKKKIRDTIVAFDQNLVDHFTEISGSRRDSLSAELMILVFPPLTEDISKHINHKDKVETFAAILKERRDKRLSS